MLRELAALTDSNEATSDQYINVGTEGGGTQSAKGDAGPYDRRQGV